MTCVVERSAFAARQRAAVLLGVEPSALDVRSEGPADRGPLADPVGSVIWLRIGPSPHRARARARALT